MSKKEKRTSTFNEDPFLNRRLGTPYGKPLRPATQDQTRGCGDPACPTCNPETASRYSAAEQAAAASRPMGAPDSFRAMQEDPAFIRARNEIAASWVNSINSALVGSVQDAARDKQTPPESYNKARKAVEQYILLATHNVGWEDIVGNEAALSQLKDAIEAPVKQQKLYEYYGMKMPKGALLSGPPGCGKTMFAKAAATAMAELYGTDVDFISLSGGEMQTMYVGETEAKIKAIFTFAREYKAYKGHPLVIFIDEAEVILPDRTGRVRRVAPWEESQVSVFLSEMDGVEECGAFVLLATNRPEVIDQAVLRDGRCDFKIKIDRPSKEAIQHIVTKNLEGVPTEVSTDDLAFAAVESFYDPHKVIETAKAVYGRIQEDDGDPQLETETFGKDFTFEYIVSGAMAASVPTRAKRYAFARDKSQGTTSGITTEDIIRSVNDLFEENRGLEHSFALTDFMDKFKQEAQIKVDKLNKKGLN